MAIPGIRFLAFAARWFDAATVARVFEPLIAGILREPIVHRTIRTIGARKTLTRD